jgi:hypothetical protein
MSEKTKTLITLALMVFSFAAGRWLVPEKVKIEKQIVEVEKKSKDKNAEKNTRKTTTTTKTVYPDGRVEESTVVVEETDRKSSSTEVSEGNKTETELKEITNSSSKVSIQGLAGYRLTTSELPLLGLSVSKPILGPITVGVWGLNNSTFGASLGLTF